PGEDEVLVRVHAASICGTDLHIHDWNEWAESRIRRVPMTFGHELAGTVETVGDEVHHIKPGAFVAAETHIACGYCATCRTGRAHICQNLRILGVDTDGAFAEFVVIPAENAWVVGFPAESGTFTSGGTVSNTTALAAARERALPRSRVTGLSGHRVAVYCSREVHYSITRAVELLGIGSENLRALPTDEQRRLRPEALARAIEDDVAAGITPIAVVASAGTTLTGAIDPLDDLADVCEPRGVWLHVDGAYGLPAAGVASMREAFRGLERADSVSVDAHKWLYLPKACGVMLVRRGRDLEDVFAHQEGYLPHQKHELHAVDITLEYSRPFRALKFWLAFRAHGAPAFRAAIERNLAEARLLYDEIGRYEDLEALAPPQLSIVPFRHVPDGVADVNAHNVALAEALESDGRVYLASALIDGEVYLRPCFVNFRTTEEDVLALVDIVREVGSRLARA
ncbi:MAG: aminotransferase class V-fold PLP-dependent enzyme, partial [Solirubrobacterales bacterium]